MITVEQLQKCRDITFQTTEGGIVIFTVKVTDHSQNPPRNVLVEVNAPSCRGQIVCKDASIQTVGDGGNPPPYLWTVPKLEGTLEDLIQINELSSGMLSELRKRDSQKSLLERIAQTELFLRQAAEEFLQQSSGSMKSPLELGTIFTSTALKVFTQCHDARTNNGAGEFHTAKT